MGLEVNVINQLRNCRVAWLLVSIVALVSVAVAQRSFRDWGVNQITIDYPVTASTIVYGANSTSITVAGDVRTITTNSVASHAIGGGNPNSPSSLLKVYRVDATPSEAPYATPTSIAVKFGVTVTGILFDAYAAEFFAGDPNGWNYSAPGNAIGLRIDDNGGHVQPDGLYHLHGLPTDLMGQLGWSAERHSPLIGFAADGFPIYALTGEAGQVHTSSYVLKTGTRPTGGSDPGGTYDGTFHNDWAFQSGAGSLDACNGTTTVNGDYPNGTYAYFLTVDYPVIPACLTGTPSDDFKPALQRR